MVTQKPSWVRPPSYKAGAASSLILAFEDPDSSKLNTMPAERYLHAFGNRIKVKRWKQEVKKQKETSSQATAAQPQDGDTVGDEEEDVDILLTEPTPPPSRTPATLSTSSRPNPKRKAQAVSPVQDSASSKGWRPTKRKLAKAW